MTHVEEAHSAGVDIANVRLTVEYTIVGRDEPVRRSYSLNSSTIQITEDWPGRYEDQVFVRTGPHTLVVKAEVLHEEK